MISQEFEKHTKENESTFNDEDPANLIISSAELLGSYSNFLVGAQHRYGLKNRFLY